MNGKLVLGFVLGALSLSGLVFAASDGVGGVIDTLKNIGVFEFYLPFLLTFSIFYALILKSKIFGENNNTLATIIALAASGFIMVYTPVGITLTQFLAQFVGNSIVVILTVLIILLLGGMLQSGGINVFSLFGEKTKGGLWVVLLLIVLVAFGVFVSSGGTKIFPGLPTLPRQIFGSFGGISTSAWAILILIVGTGLIVWAFARSSKGGAPPAAGAAPH